MNNVSETTLFDAERKMELIEKFSKAENTAVK